MQMHPFPTIAAALVVFSTNVFAQPAAKATPLGPATGTLGEEFSRLLSVRELSNGKVLITDDKDSRLFAADFQSGKTRMLGRMGDGPGEFRAVGRLWDVGNDSTLMSVPYRGRILLLHHDSIVATITGNQEIILALGGSIVRGADARGNLLNISVGSGPAKEAIMADSFTIVRTNRKTVRKDAVTKVANTDKDLMQSARPAAKPGTAEASKKTYHISIRAREQITMFPDGTIAVLRGNPYRVDWCYAPATACVNGATQAFDSRRWTDDDKKAYLSVQSGSGSWPPTENIDETTGWPDQLPPFATPGGPDDSNFWATAAGNVVVERVSNSGMTLRTYDVINRQSKRVASVSVPRGHRILGFGKGTVYVVHVDSDGIERLQRHAWAF
ncbi:MAG: hypothetical protein ABI852_14145 [Gemmatimonadaceae bacterium]